MNHTKLKIKISNEIVKELDPEIKFQRSLIYDLKYAIDHNFDEEQIQYIRDTLNTSSRNLFTFYEIYEKCEYKKNNLDYTESYSYNYLRQATEFWEKYQC